MDKAHRNRDAILRSAIAEFAQFGLAGARGDRIAQRAGSSERMVYYYFETKELLYRCALEQVYAELRDAEQGLDLDSMEALAAIEAFCRFVWNYYREHPEFVSVLNTENLREASSLQTSPHLALLVAPVVSLLERIVKRGQQAGELRAEVDAQRLYVLIASLGYFVIANRHTLSAVLAAPVAHPRFMEPYLDAALEMVVCYVRS
jgi:AcrR family transcriptional regulator